MLQGTAAAVAVNADIGDCAGPTDEELGDAAVAVIAEDCKEDKCDQLNDPPIVEENAEWRKLVVAAELEGIEPEWCT